MKDLREADDLPGENDPAYDNPLGKLPVKPKQPFDFAATMMHTDAERQEWERVAARAELPYIRLQVCNQVPAQLKSLQKWMDASKPGNSNTEEDKRHRRVKAAYARAIEIWAAEVGIFVRDLRLELADLIEQEFPDANHILVKELRGESL